MAWQQSGIDGPAAGIEIISWRASTGDAGPLVIACHDTASFYESPDRKSDLKHMAEAGLCVVAVDCEAFGNDAALGVIDDTITWAASELGADTSRVSFVGDSRGATTSLNWAWRNPGQAGALALRIPGVALEAIHSNDLPSGIAASIEAAYPGDDLETEVWPFRDPSHPDLADEIAVIADRCRVWYSEDDPWVLPSQVTSWTDTHGVDLRSLGATGHDPWSTGALPYVAITEWVWRILNEL